MQGVKRLLVPVLGALMVLGAPQLLADSSRLPQIPAAKGEACVEPTDVMRRNHMDYLLHQRDDTVHAGIRTTKYSLKACLECHVRPDEAGAYPRSGTPEHFCSSCHTYAAVKIDCFSCHADRP
jgi:hypothetical protein